jgi:hypothetical protein
MAVEQDKTGGNSDDNVTPSDGDQGGQVTTESTNTEGDGSDPGVTTTNPDQGNQTVNDTVYNSGSGDATGNDGSQPADNAPVVDNSGDGNLGSDTTGDGGAPVEENIPSDGSQEGAGSTTTDEGDVQGDAGIISLGNAGQNGSLVGAGNSVITNRVISEKIANAIGNNKLNIDGTHDGANIPSASKAEGKMPTWEIALIALLSVVALSAIFLLTVIRPRRRVTSQ